MPTPEARQHRRGVTQGIAAYLAWGLFPLFFQLLDGVASLEFVSYRSIWSFAWLILFLLATGKLSSYRNCFRSWSSLWRLTLSMTMIAANWGLFIYAVTNEHVLQSSLGYFINPLVSVLLGVVVLGERLRRPQAFAVLIALVGVLVFTIAAGEFPLIALGLAVSFGLYGLIRKTTPVDGLVGLSVEVTLAAPFGLAYIAWVNTRGVPSVDTLPLHLLFIISGPITVTPLILFVGAAHKLRLATVGILQYICPTLHFVWAVFLFNESFSGMQLISFLFIWTAVILYATDAVRAEQSREKEEAVDPQITLRGPIYFTFFLMLPYARLPHWRPSLLSLTRLLKALTRQPSERTG
jgi:chloramphenicol-sensitive protein RarD